MRSRDRVIKAIEHKKIDRVPIDLGMHNATGISAFAYQNLRAYLGLTSKPVDIGDMNQLLARVEEEILKRFHCDCMMLSPKWDDSCVWEPREHYRFLIPSNARPKLNEDGSWEINRNNENLVMPSGGYFFEGGWGDFYDHTADEILEMTAREAERIYKQTDYFMTYLNNFYGYFRCEDEEFLCTMITDPKDIYEENRKICEKELIRAGRIVDSLGRYVQAVCFNSDLGSQKSTICRPSLYQDLCAPFVKKICDFIHTNSDMKVFMHSDGAIRELIPTIIDCGIDVLNPIQITANGMEPEKLKEDFGDKIAFWGGGCDTQGILVYGAPKEIKEHVKRNVRIFKKGSGYIFNQIHNIMGDIKPENIEAMLDAAYEEGSYR
jgi:uroporphyrinogen decarboxylase